MLSGEELREIARMRGLKPHQEEKRYIQSVVLSAIYRSAANSLIFKGGTALFLLHGLNRFSEDLDFTCAVEFEGEALENAIRGGFEFLGMEGSVQEKKSIAGKNYSVKAHGPIYSNPQSACFVRVEISMRGDIAKPPQSSIYSSGYKDMLPFAINLLCLEEMAAEKIRALLKRNYARDAYDLHFLLSKGAKPSISLIEKKMEHYEEKFSFEAFKGKLHEKEAAWKGELGSLVIGKLPEFSLVEKEILALFDV